MRANKNFLFKVKKNYLNFVKKQEALGEPFYNKIDQLNNFYIPITDLIFQNYNKNKKTLIIGLSGSQGSGKSTIAKILSLLLKSKYNLKTINFSIDDFYKTLEERKKMSKDIHKLFITRGVPGTHDTKLLYRTLKKLKQRKFKNLLIPKFNKSIDDREPKNKWILIKRKPQIIIFEGWCVGACSQSKKQLLRPINKLEKHYDKKRIWRLKVNRELNSNYQKIFRLIDKLIFLKVPSFKYVYKWRLLQEKKLKLFSKGKKIMTNIQINKFIMHYERITLHMIKSLKSGSDVVLNIDKKHRLDKIRIN